MIYLYFGLRNNIKNMINVINFFIKKIKILIFLSGIIILFCWLYCNPIEFDTIIEYILKTIFLLFAFLLMIHGAKVNNSTGATSIFKKIKVYKYSEFFFTFPCLIIGIVGIIKVFIDKDFNNSVMLLPSVFGCYCSSKASTIYINEKENIKTN